MMSRNVNLSVFDSEFSLEISIRNRVPQDNPSP